MGFLGGFSRSKKSEIIPEPPIKTSEFVKRGVRQGMWVATPTGVGIVDSISDAGDIIVMLTNEDGTNLLQAVYPSSKLTQAQYTQIPEARRPGIEQAKSLGYR